MKNEIAEKDLLNETELLDADEVAFFLEESGPLAKSSGGYEERPSQIALVKKICDAFNENKVAVFEAGTGVGKSFAYLIPSMLWAISNKERVVISTGTINLQMQLMQKDIPVAKKIIGKDVNAVLLKGRQNYVCLRRLYDASHDRELFSDELALIDELVSWAEKTKTGEKSELAVLPNEKTWLRIRSESEVCLSRRCPFFEKCFVMSAKKNAEASDILVVNHHLLFADIESRASGIGYDDAGVLPPYRRIIFDEAHTIDDSATSFFSESFQRFAILKNLNLLYREKKNLNAGYIANLAIVSANEEKASEASRLVKDAKADLQNLENGSREILQNEYTLRLCEKTARSFAPLLSLAQTLATSLSNVTALVKELMDGINEDDKTVANFWEAKLAVRHLDDAISLLNDFTLWDEKSDYVFYLTKKNLPHDAPVGKNESDLQFTVFSKTPLTVAPLMASSLFEEMKTVVCTSATLSIYEKFFYFMKKTGVSLIEKNRISIGSFASPFPYKENVLFAIPSDAPPPERYADFQNFASFAIARLTKNANGRTLILFTSYEMLTTCFASVRSSLSDESFLLLKQGSEDNARLLEKFRKDESSVLFATSSFWQGVDVPGSSLSQVIIAKLPFAVPSDPIFAARSEAVEKKGGSSFMDLSVPEAVMLFRQGFGRLMRKKTDKGAVIVLDKRLYEKRYGKIFLQSIPETNQLYAPLSEIEIESRKYFD